MAGIGGVGDAARDLDRLPDTPERNPGAEALFASTSSGAGSPVGLGGGGRGHTRNPSAASTTSTTSATSSMYVEVGHGAPGSARPAPSRSASSAASSSHGSDVTNSSGQVVEHGHGAPTRNARTLSAPATPNLTRTSVGSRQIVSDPGHGMRAPFATSTQRPHPRSVSSADSSTQASERSDDFFDSNSGSSSNTGSDSDFE
jgi:hypothetical protein